jgi:hypothetical protein
MKVITFGSLDALDSTEWWARQYVRYSEVTHFTFAANVCDNSSAYVLHAPCRAAMLEMRIEVCGHETLAFPANQESFRGNA